MFHYFTFIIKNALKCFDYGFKGIYAYEVNLEFLENNFEGKGSEFSKESDMAF